MGMASRRDEAKERLHHWNLVRRKIQDGTIVSANYDPLRYIRRPDCPTLLRARWSFLVQCLLETRPQDYEVGVVKDTKSLSPSQWFSETPPKLSVAKAQRDRLYSPLRGDEIRVLVLQQSESRSVPLRGRLETRKLEGTGIYEAISYTWGTDISGGSLELSGIHIPIPLNLQLALFEYRDSEREPVLWVDAVCIDMHNLEERSEQILLLPKIFGRSSNVFVWLGEETSESARAMLFLRKVITSSDLDDVLRGNRSSADWEAVGTLLSCPYFSRIWVVQEVALARRASIHVGREALDWVAFQAAISVFDTHRALVRARMPLYDDIEAEGASRFVGTIRKCFRRDELGRVQEPLLSLEELVYDLSYCNAADARDKIFALLAIARDIDVVEAAIVPDYSKSVEDVYQDFYRFCIGRTGSLDVLFRPWNDNIPMPLWHNTRASRTSASLVRQPGREQYYHAGNISSYKYPKTLPSITSGDTLTVFGFLLDRIDLIGDVCSTNSEIPVSWFTVASEAEIRHLLLSSLPDSLRLEAENRIDFWKDQGGGQMIWHASSSPVRRAISDLARGRVLFRTLAKRALGLAPAAARRLDKLCIFPKCSVPVLLFGTERESAALEMENPEFGIEMAGFEDAASVLLDVSNVTEFAGEYEIVGPCYVQGYMNKDNQEVTVDDLPLQQYDVVPAMRVLTTRLMSRVAEPERVTTSNPDMASYLRIEQIERHVHQDTYPEIFGTDVYLKGIRLNWTCHCGHRGFGHYIEHRPGAVNELAKHLEKNGFRTSMVPWNPLCPEREIMEIFLLRTRNIIGNLLLRIFLAVTRDDALRRRNSNTIVKKVYEAEHSQKPRFLRVVALTVVALGILLGRIAKYYEKKHVMAATTLYTLSPFLPPLGAVLYALSRLLFTFSEAATSRRNDPPIGRLIPLGDISPTSGQPLSTEPNSGVISSGQAARSATSRFSQATTSGGQTPTHGAAGQTLVPGAATAGSRLTSGASSAPQGQQSQNLRAVPGSQGQTAGQGSAQGATDDFILLCFKVKKFLTLRHDIGVIRIRRDRDLFKAFRSEYDQKKGWLYRTFSFLTVQGIHFVKFTLLPRREVGGFDLNELPPVTEHHYEFTPLVPLRRPPYDSEGLTHRFYYPDHCLQDDYCLQQIPKRKNERPQPGVPPDLYTGWGMQLEEGLDITRFVIILLVGFISSVLFGVLWAVLKGSIQDGFSVAGYIATSEALAVASVQLFLTIGGGR